MRFKSLAFSINCICIAIAATTYAAQESVLLGDPDIEAAAQAIRDQNTITVEKTIREVKVIEEIRYCRYGLFGRRLRAIRIEREVTIERTVVETVSNLDDGIGWSNIGDPRLGFFEHPFPVENLPAAAGARGTKIDRAADAVLLDGDRVASDYRNLDRVLVRTPLQLPGPSFQTELVRIEAKVGGLNDESAIIGVKVQRRDAAGNLIVDASTLDARAKELWKLIETQLKK